MRLNINFINTGLDDRIVKSLTHSMKTEKMVLVHDHKKGDYYRKQKVNVEQPKRVNDHKHSNTGSSDDNSSPASVIKETLQKLLGKLKGTNIELTTVNLKSTEDDDPYFMSNTQDSMWEKIKNIIKKSEYKDYAKYDSESVINYELGSPKFEKLSRIQPGAKEYSEFDKSLKAAEYTAIRGYTYSRWTYRLNNWLRGLKGEDVKLPKDSRELDIVKTITKQLDRAIDKYELKKPTVMYRSMRIGALEHILSKGDGTFKDEGFISTTALRNCFSLGDEPVVTLAIKVPAGKGVGMWLKPHSKIPSENEFLLAHGTEFKINTMNIDYDKNGNPVNAMLEVEVIGRNPKELEPREGKMTYPDFVDACEEQDNDENED